MHITLHKPLIKPNSAEHNDIRTLSTLLTKLTNKTNAYENADMVRVIALLRKCIDRLDDIRKIQSKTLTHDKLDMLLTRIAEIINTYAPDKRTEIGVKLLAVGKEYAEPSQAE